MTEENMKEFKGKVAVVTGGASGIGRAVADRFAAEGMKIVLSDVEEQALSLAVKEMKSTGAEVAGIVTDVSDGKQVAALAEKTLATFGSVHIICNNAGVGGDGSPSWELAPETWQWVIGVNLWGVIHGIRAFVPIMLKQGTEGHVVNVASMAGLLTGPLLSPYYATKHAVVALSECLHYELTVSGAKLRASVLCPGFVSTNIMDSNRNRPDDLRVEDREKTPIEVAMEEAFRKQVEGGIPPSQVANLVFEAIRDEKFYIFPHPDLLEAYREYSETVLGHRNPVLNLERLAVQVD
jgi:NAD(P)-dependent dehydrogenase (short-subunit alcohol dehydrogenase family)